MSVKTEEQKTSHVRELIDIMRMNGDAEMGILVMDKDPTKPMEVVTNKPLIFKYQSDNKLPLYGVLGKCG